MTRRKVQGSEKETEPDARFRPTLLKVLLVQVVALILLWLLQATYHS